MNNAQLIDAWLEYLGVARGRSSRTQEAYRLALQRLCEFLEGGHLLAAQPQELEMFCGLWLQKKGIVAQSRKPYISAVKGFYRWARSKGFVEVSAALDVAHPQMAYQLPDTISLANAERLLCAPDLGTFKGIRDSTILHLLMGCGLRVSGLCQLNEGDLQHDVIDGQVRMAVLVSEKGKRDRLVPVPKEAAMLLQVYLAHEDLRAIDRNVKGRGGRPDKVLFVSIRNATVAAHQYRGANRRLGRQSVHDMMQRYGKAVGIPPEQLHPHALRHLFGTEMVEDDVPTVSVQKLMGHASEKSVALYVLLSKRKSTRLVDQHGPIAKMRTPVSDLLKRLPGR